MSQRTRPRRSTSTATMTPSRLGCTDAQADATNMATKTMFVLQNCALRTRGFLLWQN